MAMSVFESTMLWLTALYYGIVVLFGILKDVLRLGYSKVLKQKEVARPSCLDDPTLGTHGYLRLEDVRIHYVASGPEDKPLMLFLHGFPEFWFSFRYQIREFQKDYRVVAIDMRGYGDSEKPAQKDAYTMKKLASDVKQVIMALGYKSCILVGHDWGGALAWYFRHFYSDMLDGVIAMSAPPIPLYHKVLPISPDQRKLSWYVFFFQLPYLPELFMRCRNFDVFDTMFGRNGASMLSFLLEPFRKPFNQEEIDAYKYTFSQPGALTPTINYYRCLFKPDPSDEYQVEDTVPTLLIMGNKDGCLVPLFAEMMEKDYPMIPMKRVPEGGHFVQMEAPDSVNSAMREWLKQQGKA